MVKKAIIPLLLLVLAFVVLAMFLQALKRPALPSNFQEIVILPLVKGCAEPDVAVSKGPAGETKYFDETEYVGQGVEQEPIIEINGNEVVYSRAINHLCCRKVVFEKEISDSVINLFEVWSGIACKCICFSEIKAKLQNVPPGTYTVNVYEKGTQPGSDEPMEQRMIISKTLVVG